MILYCSENLLGTASSQTPPTITEAAVSSPFDKLPDELAEKIFSKLCTGDRVRARLVCKSWRGMLMRDNIPVALEAPWLILSDDCFFKPEYTLTEMCFKSLHEERTYRFNLPGGEFRAGPGSRWCCCGSSRGWLLMAVWSESDPHVVRMFLWNPISGAERKLPAPSTLPFFSDIVHYVIQERRRISLFTWRLQVFSIGSVECTAVIFINPGGVHGPHNQLVMCSMHDRSWKVFEEEEEEQYIYKDILFHKGKLHVMRVSDKDDQIVNFNETKTIHLRGCDVEVDILSIRRKNVRFEDDGAPYERGFSVHQRWEMAGERLVELPTGELLVVSTIFNLHSYVSGGNETNVERCDYTETGGFEVWRVAGCRLEKVSGIGEQGIFVGATGSISLGACVNGVDADCIYFATDDARWRLCLYRAVDGDDDLERLHFLLEQGIFYMQKNRIQITWVRNLSVLKGSITGWFTPKLFQY